MPSTKYLCTAQFFYFCALNMKYQIGDKILVLHSQEEGEVVDLINDKMVMIEVDRIRFPVYMDQIDFPYFKMFSEKKLRPAKEKQYIDNIKKEKNPVKPKATDGVWFSFLPVFDKDIFDDDVVESFKLYLVNHTGEAYIFNYTLNFSGKQDFELKNEKHKGKQWKFKLVFIYLGLMIFLRT